MRKPAFSCAERLHGSVKLLLLKTLSALSILPLGGRYPITDFLATAACLCMGSQRRAVTRNLTLLKGNRPRFTETLAVFREYGRYWAELPAIHSFRQSMPMEYVGSFPPTEKCFVGLTFHIGNFELFGEEIYHHTGNEFSVVVERLRPDALTDYFMTVRSRHHIVSIFHDDVRSILTTLKNSRPLGIVCDRIITGRGVRSSVLGTEVAMPLNIVRYCLKSGIPIYVSYIVKSGGKLRLESRKIPPACDLDKALEIVTATFEEAIRRYPTQWHLLSDIKNGTEQAHAHAGIRDS